MMGATVVVVRNCISQRLSSNNSTRCLPFPITLFQHRIIHFSALPSTSRRSSVDEESSSSMSSSFFSTCAISTSSIANVDRLGRSGGVRKLRNALAPACRRKSANLTPSFGTKLNYSCVRGSQSNVLRWKKMLKGGKVECSSQAGSEQAPSSVLPPVEVKSPGGGLRISFCPKCGGNTERRIPTGEHEMRVVCTVCGTVHYENPKMVVGCLVEHEDQVLLCKRSIQPSYGLWTLPAGYMEIGESAAEGAARETWEEACAEVEVLGLFAHLDIPFIGQSYIIFRARLKNPHFAPGPESLECALFKLNEIPFDKLAFSSIGVSLKLYLEDVKAGKIKVHHGVIDKRPGAVLSDPEGFVIRDHLSS